MNEQERKQLINEMKEVFATKEDLFMFSTKEDAYEFRKEMNSRFDAIEKDIKSVVRIYNLDEEMNAVYARLKQLEQVAGIVN